MSVKASSLKYNDNKRKAIKKEVSTILQYIDDEIKKAYDCDKRTVSVLLPIQFSIPYMSNSTAQRIIYFEILTSLLDRDFCVEIDISKDKALFDVTWYTREEIAEIDHQITVIANHSKKNPLNKDLN